MKTITLTQNKVALVDDEDYQDLQQYRWQFAGGYAIRITARGKQPRKTIMMHRVINKTPNGLATDHINGNKLDNRKCNLRSCNAKTNAINREAPKNNTSGYKGVYKDSKSGKWYAQASVDGKRKHLGYFKSKIEAAQKYNESVKQIYGDYAKLNIMEY